MVLIGIKMSIFTSVLCFLIVTKVYPAPVNPQPPLPEVKEGTDPMDVSLIIYLILVFCYFLI